MALKIAEGNRPRPTAKRRTGIDAGMLEAHEVTSLRALRFRMLQVREALSANDENQQKALLDRRVAMLTNLGPGYAVREELGQYRVGRFHTDTGAD